METDIVSRINLLFTSSFEKTLVYFHAGMKQSNIYPIIDFYCSISSDLQKPISISETILTCESVLFLNFY